MSPESSRGKPVGQRFNNTVDCRLRTLTNQNHELLGAALKCVYKCFHNDVVIFVMFSLCFSLFVGGVSCSSLRACSLLSSASKHHKAQLTARVDVSWNEEHQTGSLHHPFCSVTRCMRLNEPSPHTWTQPFLNNSWVYVSHDSTRSKRSIRCVYNPPFLLFFLKEAKYWATSWQNVNYFGVHLYQCFFFFFFRKN